MIKLSLVVGAAALVAACSKKSDAPAPPAKPPAPVTAPAPTPAPPPAPPSSTWYRAVVGEKQGTAIPFFLQVPASGDAIVATGAEQIHGRLVSGLPKVDIEFDIYHTKIDATAGDKGVLDGTWSSSSKSWGAASLSFHAEPIAAPAAALRFPVTPGGPDPVGVWKIGLTKPGELAKLVLARNGEDELVGTLSFQSGNLALVAGSQDGRTIRLSSFDGSSPYLFVAKLDEQGKAFEGNWIAGQALDWKETLHGKKTADFALAHPLALVGKRPHLKLPQLDQPPYRGQPVIVELSGSWCPACGHATVELRALHDKYAAEGLQILTLAYEFTDDHAYNAQQAEAIKSKFHLSWDVVPVDGGLEKYNDILPAELSSIDAAGFPIAIFVARDGGIEGFHSGFPPESATALHQQTLDDYDRLTRKILGR